MAQPFPYTYYSCPCESTSPTHIPLLRPATETSTTADEEEEQTFDPSSPRANFSLYPLEHLLYCTECHQLRCSRCIMEEMLCWYCPSCLFEVPSSTVRSEGNRCTRSCYNCPICTSFLSVNLLETPEEHTTEQPTGPFILSCSYCNWTSLDIGIKFEKGNNITGQLQRIRNGGRVVPTPKERESQAERLLRRVTKDDSQAEEPTDEESAEEFPPDIDDLFSNLNSFYKTQLADSADMATFSGASEFSNSISSPSSITRLLNLYSTGKKMKRGKPKPMREALSIGEGLQAFDSSAEDEMIDRLATESWEATTSLSQREFQERPAHFTSDLRPIATLLRTKRSKRCKTCRSLLTRPEPKVSTTRYKIKVLALNNVPKVTLQSLSSTPASVTSSLLTAGGLSQIDYVSLQPLMPYQFLLTLTNPLFDPINVTLATPATTPGRVQTRITILCPQFTIGANTDVWDEALNSSTTSKRKSLIPSLNDTDTKQAEAGKVWEKGRNWTSVIVEVVPGVLPGTTGHVSGKGETELEEDEDVLEIPVFVRLEYETEATGGEERRSGEVGKEKREVAFWCVLGVGRIVG